MSNAISADFDVVIVGAGPAGSTAAFRCRALGLSVALIDKRAFPRDKLCGGLFTGRARKYYNDAFGAAPPDNILIEKTQVRFFHKEEDLGQIDGFPSLYLTMRWDLDDDIFRKAIDAGCTDYSGCRIQSLDLENCCVTLADGRRIQGKALIGADGVNSDVARALFGAPFDKETIGFGLEVEIQCEAPPVAEPVRIDFAAAEWGYGWSFPKRKTTTVGVGGILSKNADMKERMSRYLEELGHDPANLKLKGHFIPFGSYRKNPGRGGVLLCGDAAGLVDPITGEGIAFALKSGQLAAESVARAIGEGDPASAFSSYKSSLRHIHTSLGIARLVRPIIFRPMFERLFFRSFRSSTTLRHEYMRLLAGEVEYQHIARLLVWKVPKLLFRALKPKG